MSDVDVMEPTKVKQPKAEHKIERPKMFKVVILNDDFTPVEFVVSLVMEIFNKTEDEATVITMQVHKGGKGICGVYTKEIAETKANQVNYISRKSEHPLKCIIESE